MEDLNIVIAGAAGEGVQTVGDILTRTISAQGYAVFAWQEYESRIRGGQNSYSIRIGEHPQNAPLMRADVLLALNQGVVKKYQPLLKEGGTLIAPKEQTERMIAIAFAEIAEEEFKNKIYANTIAVGVLAGVIGIDLDALKQVLAHTFKEKGATVVKSNLSAAELGYRRATQECRDLCPWKLPEREGRYYLISGNEAIPLAAAFAGCRFIAAYPMTPSTGIITFFALHGDRLGVFAEQAEDGEHGARCELCRRKGHDRHLWRRLRPDGRGGQPGGNDGDPPGNRPRPATGSGHWPSHQDWPGRAPVCD